MSFVGDMFDSSKGSGFQAQAVPLQQAVTQAQTDQAYGNTQTGLGQQQAFVNALQAQNGIANQANVYNQYQGVANGTGPNPAQAMLNQSTGQNVNNQAALMASQRGSSQNAGLIARQAAQQGANLQQQAIGQGASLQAQQSLGALGQMGNISGQQVSQQGSAIGNYNQFAQGQQQNLLNAVGQYNSAAAGQQASMNQANASIAGANIGAQGALLGGLIGGAGAAASGGATAAAAHGGTIERYAKGGEVTPSSAAGRFLTGFQQGSSSGIKSQNPMYGAGQEIGQGLVAGGKALYNAFTPSQSVDPQGLGSQFAGQAPTLGVAPQAAPQGPSLGASLQFAQGGMPTQNMTSGGKVPGQARVAGDSYANDTVPAILSPKEIVLPRSITMGQNAPEAAKQFVINELRKQKGHDAGGYAEGGEVKKDEPTININIPNSNSPQSAQESVNVNPHFMKQGQNMAMNQSQPKFAEESSPQYQYEPQGAPIPPQAAPQGPQNPNLNFGEAQSSPQGNSPLNQLPTRDIYENPIKEQEASLGREAEAKGQQGSREAQVYGQGAQSLEDINARHQEALQKINASIDSTAKDIDDGKINPNHLYESMSTPGKIVNAIGLILGGIGGGLTHQENPALKFLQSQIDRDIQAQRANLGKKENLLSAFMKQTGNLNEATQLAKASLLNATAFKIDKMGALSKNPIEKERALQAANQLRLSYAPQVSEAAIRTSLLSQNGAVQNQGNTQNLDAFKARYLAPKGKEESVEKDLKEFEDLRQAKADALKSFDEANKVNTFWNRNVAGRVQTPKKVAAYLEPTIADTTKFTVNKFTEADQAALRHIFDTANADPETVAIQRQQLATLYDKKMHFPSLRGVGINTGAPTARAQENPSGFKTARK